MEKNKPETDEEIVVRVKGGDTDAYGELMSRYEARLIRYVTYLTHDSTTARDIVQDTFIKAYQSLNSFNPHYAFSSWIYRIAHNETMNTIKKNRYWSDADIDKLPPLRYDSRIEEKIDLGFLVKDVSGCLAALEPKYREVIQLIYFERMKYTEVSDVLHIPTSTVGVWLSRARSKLKKICEQKGVTNE